MKGDLKLCHNGLCVRSDGVGVLFSDRGELVLALCRCSNGHPGTISPSFQAACPGPGLRSLQSSRSSLC